MRCASVREFRFHKHVAGAIERSIHDSETGGFAVERFEWTEKIEDKEQHAEQICERKRACLLQINSQPKNRRNACAVENGKSRRPRRHATLERGVNIARTRKVFCERRRLCAEQIVALDHTDALDKREHGIGQSLALLLTRCRFLERNSVHAPRHDVRQKHHCKRDEPEPPIQPKHEDHQDTSAEQIAHHIGDGTHGNLFNENHIV